MRTCVCLLIVTVCLSGAALAATHTAASCAQVDVQAAVNAASERDTVQIPAGTCVWTAQLAVRKGITVQGAGQGVTIIIDNIPKNGNDTSAAFLLQAASPSNIRLTGFSFRGMATDPNIYNKGHVIVTGTMTAFRVDHITVTTPQTSFIRTDGCVYGLIDHLDFTGDRMALNAYHSNCGNSRYGDGSWVMPIEWGSGKAVYLEDSILRASSGLSPVYDGFQGSRVVIRHNQVINGTIVTHGTDTGGRLRSQRYLEVYENDFTTGVVDALIWIRGGSGVFFNNRVKAEWMNFFLKLANCRDVETGCGTTGIAGWPPFGACDGTSPYDQNLSSPGYRCLDQPGAGTSRDLGGLDIPTRTWVGNAPEPIYEWNNSLSMNPKYGTASGSSSVKEGRDFFVGTPRPGYSPYTYPHPLQGGSSAAIVLDPIIINPVVTTPVDSTAPVPGNAGLINPVVGETSATLNWFRATDNVSPQSALQYEVRLSTNGDIDTVAKAEAYGAIVKPYLADISSAVIGGLTAGRTYYLNVIVRDEAGNKSIYRMTSATALVTDTTAPIPGTSGTISSPNVTWNSVTLGWGKATDNVTSQSQLLYEVRRSSSDNIDTVTRADAYGTVVRPYSADIGSATITGLTGETTYYFNVIVKDAAGNRASYLTRRVTTPVFQDTTAPSPGNSGTISKGSITPDTVTINWPRATDDASPQAELQYEVRRSLANNIDSIQRAEANGAVVQNYTPDITSSVNSNLSSGMTYFFNVIVKDAAGNKAIYRTLSVTMPGDTTAPTPGNGGQMTSTSNSSSITLNWTKAADNFSSPSALRYEVRISTSNNISTVARAELNGTVVKPYTADINTHVLTNLSSGTEYFINVLVKDESNNKAIYVSRAESTTGRRMTQLNLNGRGLGPIKTEESTELQPPAPSTDTTAPIPGGSGLVAISGITQNGLTLRWTTGTDDTTPKASLLYQVVESSTKNINTVAQAESNGSVILAFAPDTSSLTLKGLDNAVQHYFTVIVKDEAGNKAVYATAGNLGESYSYQANGGASFATVSTGTSSLKVTQLQVTPGQGTASPAGLAIVRATGSKGIMSTAGLPLSGGIRSGTLYTDMTLATDTSEAVKTGIAFANPSAQDAEISFFFTDANGVEVKSGLYTLLANHQISGFLDESPFNGPGAFKGTFTFSSSAPISAIGTRSLTQRNGEFLLQSLPIVSGGSEGTSSFLPAFVDGGGWSTELVLTNSSSALQVGKVEFWSQGSAGVSAVAQEMKVNGVSAETFSFSIPPRSVVRLVTAGESAEAKTGSVRISTTGALTSGAVPDVLAIISSRSNGNTITQTSLAAVPTGKAFRSYVETSTSPYWVKTSLAIVNSSDNPNTLNLTLTKLDGTPVTSTSLTVPPSGQTSQFLTDIFPGLANGFQGLIRVSSSAPVGFAVFRWTSNSAGEFLFASTPPQNEAVNVPSSGLAFPLVASGAGYDTQVVLFGQSGQSGNGEMMFVSKDGVPQTATSLGVAP